MNTDSDWSPVPHSYVLNGTAFQNCAEAVIQTLEIDERGIPKKMVASPVYFLLSHAAELFLKAALLKQGKTESLLKNFNYRHNLTALMGELDSVNLSISDETKTIIERLSEQHSKHVLRYNPYTRNDIPIFWTSIPETLKALDELMLLSQKPRPSNNQ